MWDKMEVFYHVVKAGTFTKAESVLNKSQSAISRTVSDLEYRLGTKLLVRKHKGIQLTRKGEEAFRIAQKMFMEMGGFKKSLSDNKDISGKIRIATTHVVATYILMEHLLEFNKEYPDIVFELVADDSLIDIVQKEVDIGVRPYDSDNVELIQKHLFTVERGLYASEDYLEKYGEPKSLEDLDDHRIIARSRPKENPYADVNWVLKVGRENKDPRKPVFTGNSFESLLKAASEGVGIVTSYKEIEAVRKNGLVRVLPNILMEKSKNYIVYPKSLANAEKIKTLETFLMKKLLHLREN